MPDRPVTADVAELLERADRSGAEGDLDGAQAAAQRILEIEPGHPGALRVVGLVLLARKQLPFAIMTFERAIAAFPEYAPLRVALGRALASSGDNASALASYEAAVALAPGDAEAQAGRGAALLWLSRADEARAVLAEAVAIDPDRADSLFWLANALVAVGDHESARAHFDAAVRRDPAFRSRHLEFVIALRSLEREDEALAACSWGAVLRPDEPELQHRYAALSGGAPPPRASDEYVVQLFDRFSGEFDHHLRDNLSYRGPEMIRDVLVPLVAPQADVLDAGCGTGLCAPLLRPHARRLTGIDLSPGMLGYARATGLYDDLHEGELTAVMRTMPAAYDAIGAADVLIYFGELEQLIGVSAEALRPGGILAVTVEREDERDYALRPSGRYAHSAAYLRDCAAAAGLAEVAFEDGILRVEQGVPIRGHVAAFRR